MHVWETYVHRYTIYEVSMSNPVEVCTDNDNDANDTGCKRRQTMHDCIYKALWLINQLSQKACFYYIKTLFLPFDL